MAAELIIIVFVVTYIAISSEKVNRTATALLGMGVAGIVLWATGEGAFSVVVEHIEWSTILFVTSMFIIVTIAASSGMFQFLALELTRPTQGQTKKLFVSLLGFVFVISLFFDTTSTMLIMGPLTIELCKALDIDFRPFLISEAVTCNFASIPSIVGAVPNLLIADQANVDPGFLLATLLPLSGLLFVVSVPIFLRVFEDQLQPSEEDLVSQMMLINPQYMIRSRSDFYLSIVAMIILILGFTLGPGLEPFPLQPALIAITVASALLILSREWVDEILKRVNWGTIFFLVGLFGLVAALHITGVIEAHNLHDLGTSNPLCSHRQYPCFSCFGSNSITIRSSESSIACCTYFRSQCWRIHSSNRFSSKYLGSGLRRKRKKTDIYEGFCKGSHSSRSTHDRNRYRMVASVGVVHLELGGVRPRLTAAGRTTPRKQDAKYITLHLIK
ncbi:MAG: SLC13 family permease [Candidatus Thorarchaeota archaeon]